MRKPPQVCALALLLISASYRAGLSQEPADMPPANSALTARIQTALGDRTVVHAHWGISVTALDGTPLYSLDDNKLFRPASTAKLFTTAAAMALLGPDHTFTTTLYGDLDANTGTVKGDLTLVGGGDPSFGTSDLPYLPARERQATDEPPADAAVLNALSTALTTAGVRRITGNIVGDDTLFEAPAVPEGWAAEDLLWGYGALPSALTFADNEIRLTVSPGPPAPAAGTDAGTDLTSTELFPYLHVNNQVLTLSADKQHPDGIDAEALPGSAQTIRLFGRLSPTAPPVHETIAVDDAAAYAAGALRASLLQHGIDITGMATARHTPRAFEVHAFVHELRSNDAQTASSADVLQGSALPCPGAAPTTHLLAQHTSPPLAQEVAFTLKTSANLHAELMLHHLGLLHACPGTTTLQGAKVLRSWMEHIGIAPEDFLLYDGSGLSTKDLVTPHAEAQLLAYAARQPWAAAWQAALPLGGVDGTLAGRFLQPPLKGHVSAKTGTLGETRALAGYVLCASGQRRIVVILVDDHEPGSTADRDAMDAIVAAVAELE